jgi:phenylalanine-4-hydroxylase
MEAQIETNPLIDRLPKHLKQFIKPQNYDEYTPINQAVWRYVMRKNVDYLSKVAHSSYLEGLRKTGISIENIPNMYGMNRILKEIGWAAVAVDGFIPPNAFMEFQAYNVLVIASDIRQLEHIEHPHRISFTKVPDTLLSSRILNMQNICDVLEKLVARLFLLLVITKCMKPSVCFLS